MTAQPLRSADGGHGAPGDGPRDLDPAPMPTLVGAPWEARSEGGMPYPVTADSYPASGHPHASSGHRHSASGHPEPADGPGPSSYAPGATSYAAPGSTSYPGPSGSPRGMVRRWLDSWWAVVLLLLGLLTAPFALALATLAIAGFFSLPAALSGAMMLVPALWGAYGMSRLERHRVAAFTGVDIGPPPPSTAPTWRRALGLDEPRLKALGWAGLHGLWAVLMGAVTLTVVSMAVILAGLPLYAWALPEQGLSVWGLPALVWPSDLLQVGETLPIAVASLIGVLVLLVGPMIARGLVTIDINLARWLIGTDPQQQLREMSRRVQTLTTTREQTIDSVEAERRRIERDLHDGPQQRLVSIAMSLGLARDALERDPADPMVRSLLDEAHQSSKEAIVEMRQVARGIVPPILADRGLDAAVSALAARSPVPVSVSSSLPAARLDATVEAIAYFCVSEALTNVAKHSGARRATVDLGTAPAPSGDLLAITVTDDGGGGAVFGAGTGLTGLRQRVASVDGQLHVHSPDGAGTTLAITLPLRTRGTQ